MNKVRAVVWFISALFVFAFIWGMAEAIFPGTGGVLFKIVVYAAIYCFAFYLAGKMCEYGTKIWRGETLVAERKREAESLRQQAEWKESQAQDLRAKAAELLRSA